MNVLSDVLFSNVNSHADNLTVPQMVFDDFFEIIILAFMYKGFWSNVHHVQLSAIQNAIHWLNNQVWCWFQCRGHDPVESRPAKNVFPRSKPCMTPLPQWNPDPPLLFQVFTHCPTHQSFHLKRMPPPPIPSLSLTAPLSLPSNVLRRLFSFPSTVCERRYINNFLSFSPCMSLTLTGCWPAVALLLSSAVTL